MIFATYRVISRQTIKRASARLVKCRFWNLRVERRMTETSPWNTSAPISIRISCPRMDLPHEVSGGRSLSETQELTDLPVRCQVCHRGSSCKPPTGSNGHSKVVEHLAKIFNEGGFWILPVLKHPFEAKRDLLPFEDRVAMTGLNVAGHTNVKVQTFENSIFCGAQVPCEKMV